MKRFILCTIVTMVTIALSIPTHGTTFAQAPSSVRVVVSPPSTILPAGTTSLTITATTQATTECRVATNGSTAYNQMTRFTTTGGTQHSTTLTGLSPDPNILNRFFVRCAAYPNDAPIALIYRSLSSVNPSFPRTGNLWGMWNFYNASTGRPDLNRMARIDLWLGAGGFRPDEIRTLRTLNPSVRVLTSYNAVELGLDGWQSPPPDDIWLKDIRGNRIEVWPGAYRVNMTRLDVAEYMAREAYNLILNSELMYDGIFIDNVFTRASWFTEDIYGNPFLPDANGDGRQDDPAELDRAWRAGLMHQLRTLRNLLPNAILSGHAQDINDPEMAQIFNATSIGFDTVNVIEGNHSFGTLWDRYSQWQTQARAPVGTMVESAIPYQIGYGYGFLPWENIPQSTLDFARDYYPYMRFGLAFTLMQDGYFAHEYGDTWHGNDWWYDELDFDLGMPLGSAQVVGTGGTQNSVTNGDFSGGTNNWAIWADASAGAAATLRTDGGSARIDITRIPPGNWQIDFHQSDRSFTAGTNYTLQFRARASTPRAIGVGTQKQSPDWDNYGLSREMTLSTSWQDYSITFTANRTANDSRLQFFLGAAVGSVWIDDVRITVAPPDVMRREFQNGLVLLNATNQPQTIQVGNGYRRLTGQQAALYEYIVDDAQLGFVGGTTWASQRIDSGDWKALPPFYHAWGRTAHVGTGTAEWDLRIPVADSYTITTWYPAAPQATTWNSAVRYEIIAADGTIAATATLDQRSNGDRWHTIGTVTLTPGARVRMTCSGAPCAADAFHVRSAARFNNGAAVTSITLQPMDGIILARGQGTTRLPGDVNGDGRVTLVDFSLLATSFNRVLGQLGYDARADFNADNAVTLTDFSLLASNFNRFI